MLSPGSRDGRIDGATIDAVLQAAGRYGRRPGPDAVLNFGQCCCAGSAREHGIVVSGQDRPLAQAVTAGSSTGTAGSSAGAAASSMGSGTSSLSSRCPVPFRVAKSMSAIRRTGS